MSDLKEDLAASRSGTDTPDGLCLVTVIKALPAECQLLYILALAKAENEGIRLGEGTPTLNAHYRQASSFLFDLLRGKKSNPKDMKRMRKLIDTDRDLCQRASFDPAMKNASGIHSCMPTFALLSKACDAVGKDPEAASDSWLMFMDTVSANYFILSKLRDDAGSDIMAETDDDVLGDKCWNEFLSYEQHCPESQSVTHHMSLIVNALRDHAYPNLDDEALSKLVNGTKPMQQGIKPLPENLINRVMKLTEDMMEILPGYEAIMHQLQSKRQGFNVMMDVDEPLDI